MNILLLQAYNGKDEPALYPLGLNCIARVLNQHNVKVFDPNISERPDEELYELLRKFHPRVVGISIRNIDSTNKRRVVFYYDHVHRMIDIVKNVIGNEAIIIAGGPGFSIFARSIMENETRIDIGVLSEAEDTFPQLLLHLQKPEQVKNVFYRRNGDVVFSGEKGFLDKDRLSSLCDYQDASRYKHIKNSVGIETKRGCVLDCIYCVYGFLNGKHYRLKNPQHVVNEIESLGEKHQINEFTFVDSTFNVPVDHAQAICKELIKRNIKIHWSAWFHDKYLTYDFVDLARQAGCQKFIMSPDGFSDDILKRLGKSQRKIDILQGYHILKSLDGIEICYNFFKNPPGQTWISLMNMIYFCLKGKWQLRNKIHFEFNSIRIEPNTKLYEISVKEGIVSKKDNLLYPVKYTNKSTSYIETLFDFLLQIVGK